VGHAPYHLTPLVKPSNLGRNRVLKRAREGTEALGGLGGGGDGMRDFGAGRGGVGGL
jgi:hypothetical protein